MRPTSNADARPQKILAAAVVVLLLSIALMVAGLSLDLPWADLAWRVVRIVAVLVIAAPALALILLWPRGGPYAPQDVRLARISALASAFMGAAMLLEGIRESAPIAFAGGAVFLPVGIYLFARSWTLPVASVAGKSTMYGAVFALSVLFGVVWSAMVFGDVDLAYTKHYTTAMKSDLRNLSGFQDVHRDSTGRFAYLHEAWSEGWKPQEDVRVQMTTTATGWHATAFHVKLDEECMIWGGSAPPDPATAVPAGEPSCRRP